MDKQLLCDNFYSMNNVVTINITMPQSDWDNLRNAEPHGGRCVFTFTGDRYDWFNATSVEVSGTAFPAGGVHRFSSVGIKKRSFCGSFSTDKPALALNFSKFNAANEALIEDLIGSKYVTLNNSVRKQLKLVKSGAFQLLNEYPLNACYILDQSTDDCAHASHVERVGEHYEAYHRVPVGAKSDRWYIVRSHARPAYKIVDRQYGTYLHASATRFTQAGHLNVYCYRFHPHDGNYFEIEFIDSPDPRTVTGFFRIKSTRTGNYIRYSITDLTPLGRKQIYQTSLAGATTLYLF